ncbi:hypothetical protein TorRG33x02_043170 [Trema orientale]|uniref:Uncharacterized protein n=1 Tax=Trema orientale TaxID=63057 RepID=A0A2P5FQ18_TREOI|nr:hypothetical protein TorRG33x02_043170 [Trema orientale]
MEAKAACYCLRNWIMSEILQPCIGCDNIFWTNLYCVRPDNKTKGCNLLYTFLLFSMYDIFLL